MQALQARGSRGHTFFFVLFCFVHGPELASAGRQLGPSRPWRRDRLLRWPLGFCAGPFAGGPGPQMLSHCAGGVAGGGGAGVAVLPIVTLPTKRQA